MLLAQLNSYAASNFNIIIGKNGKTLELPPLPQNLRCGELLLRSLLLQFILIIRTIYRTPLKKFQSLHSGLFDLGQSMTRIPGRLIYYKCNPWESSVHCSCVCWSVYSHIHITLSHKLWDSPSFTAPLASNNLYIVFPLLSSHTQIVPILKKGGSNF